MTAMENVIAERELEFLEPGETTPRTIVVRLGRPKERDGAFYAPYEIRGPGPDDTRMHEINGEDSMQALILALHVLRAELDAVARRGRLTFLGDPDIGFPAFEVTTGP